MNNLRNYTNAQLKAELLRRQKCQFNQENCTKIATLWRVKQFPSGKSQQDSICLPCAEWIEATLEAQRKAQLAKQKAQIIKNHAPKL